MLHKAPNCLDTLRYASCSIRDSCSNTGRERWKLFMFDRFVRMEQFALIYQCHKSKLFSIHLNMNRLQLLEFFFRNRDKMEASHIQKFEAFAVKFADVDEKKIDNCHKSSCPKSDPTIKDVTDTCRCADEIFKKFQLKDQLKDLNRLALQYLTDK